MKKHNPSKFIALAMAFTLLVTPMTALGAPTEESEPGTSVSVNGTGQVEGIVNEEVYRVVLPTQADNDDTFNFILDPQDLINKTEGAAHAGIDSISGNQLYFTKDSELSGTSATLEVINKSSVDVNVTVEATVNDLTGGSDDSAYEISLADSADFADDATSIYLGLNVDDDDAVALTADDGASVTKTLEGAPGQYETKYEDGYAYVLKEDADEDAFETLEFSLTGACNTNADWTNAKDAVPSVSLVWGFDKADDATAFKAVLTSSAVSILNIPENKLIAAVVLTGTKHPENVTMKNTQGTWTHDGYSNTTGGGSTTFAFLKNVVDYYSGDTVTATIQFKDGTSIKSNACTF